jgi:hypothetical protein
MPLRTHIFTKLFAKTLALPFVYSKSFTYTLLTQKW